MKEKFWFKPRKATRFFQAEVGSRKRNLVDKVQEHVTNSSEYLISRKSLAARWQCSVETIKRRTSAGQLHAIRFGPRMLRYALSEIIHVEQQAGLRS